MSKSKLGRGFDSLFPTDFDQTILDNRETIQDIKVDHLEPNPEQPRKNFDQAEIEELADSIKQHGLIQPIVVTPNGDKYYIIAGERRWRASKHAGLPSISAIVRTAQQLQRLELALVENVQRDNLSPLEQAASIKHLKDQFNMDHDTIAKKLGKSSVTVINIQRLLSLPPEVAEALNKKKITEGHARAILGIKDPKKQIELMKLIIKNDWSVRQTERYVVAHKQGAQEAKVAIKKSSATSKQTEKLTKLLKTPVSLKRMAKGGKLEIAYKNDKDLDRITKLIANK